MKKNIISLGLIGSAFVALFGVVAQGVWAATQTPDSFLSVMFGA